MYSHHLPESGRGTGDRTWTKGIPHQILSLDPSTVDSHYCVDNLLCYVMSIHKVSSQECTAKATGTIKCNVQLGPASNPPKATLPD